MYRAWLSSDGDIRADYSQPEGSTVMWSFIRSKDERGRAVIHVSAYKDGAWTPMTPVVTPERFGASGSLNQLESWIRKYTNHLKEED